MSLLEKNKYFFLYVSYVYRYNKEIPIFEQNELEKILEKFNLLDDFKSGKLKCSICEDVVSDKNFGALYNENDEIKILCFKLQCLRASNLEEENDS